jgi:hypothetical protein
MGQMEYLIMQVFPLGGSTVIAQFANSYMAIRFLEALVSGIDGIDGVNCSTYAIKPIKVDQKDTVHRFELDNNIKAEEE